MECHAQISPIFCEEDLLPGGGGMRRRRRRRKGGGGKEKIGVRSLVVEEGGETLLPLLRRWRHFSLVLISGGRRE